MKTKNKKSLCIIIGIITSILTFASIIIIQNKNKPIGENNNFNITTQINDIRVYGDTDTITNVNIDIVTKDDDKYNNYLPVIENIEKNIDSYKLNEIVFLEVSLLDQNNKAVILENPITIFIDNLYIDIYNGSFLKMIVNQDNSLNEYPMEITNYATGTDEQEMNTTVVHLDTKESATFAIINYTEETNENKNVFSKIEKKVEDNVDTESALKTVNKDYSVKKLNKNETKAKYNITNQSLVDGINYVNKFDALVLQKYETDQGEAGDEDDFNVICADSSTIFLHTKTDNTTNHINNKKENFIDVFGIDYNKYNGAFDVFYNTIKNLGLNIDYENATFDKDWYAVTKECIYEIENKDILVKTAFPNLKYDEIIDTIVNYELGVYYDPELKQNIYNINQVTIVVYYNIDNTQRMRSLVVSATYTTEENLEKHLTNGEIGLE